MAEIDVGKLAEEMAAAAAKVLGVKWPSVRDYGVGEFQKIGITILDIKKGVEAGTMTQSEAQLLLDMQKDAIGDVILTIEGLSELAAEEAINAALDVLKGALNAVLKVPLF
jgi:nucleoside-triphosphatase THEP1